MIHDGVSSNMTVNYGRIESTKVTKSYPIRDWESIYKEKIKKGYKDVTDLVSVSVTEDKKPVALGEIKDHKINSFIKLMQNYTNNLVSKTYSVKCDNVSPKQIDKAQELINELQNIDLKNDKKINSTLLELYTVIPRYMSKTQRHLLPNIDIKKVLIQEQDNLDAMASQVQMLDKTQPSKIEHKEKSILDVLGISMNEYNHNNKNIDYILKQLKNEKIQSIFEVSKSSESNILKSWLDKQDNKATRLLIHGTRCTSVIPILEQGLKIRPQGNFSYSGKIYGDGNYFSEVTNKSLNYTGYDSDKILLIYEVHTGNPFIYNGWYKGNSFTLNYKNLKERGYDSTHVNAGGGLLNSEIIAYKEEQSCVRYIIHLKR